MFSSVTWLDLTSNNGHGAACPNIHVVVFTCSINGSVLEWIMNPPPGYVVSDQVRQIIFPTIGNILPVGVEGFMFQPALTDSSNGMITSTLTTITEVYLLYGSVVTCSSSGTMESLTIILAGEALCI